jgi:PAS domain S-box-containing protein
VPTRTNSQLVLILAPFGRDAEVAANILSSAHLEALPCPTIDTLLEKMSLGAGMAIITDDSIANADLRKLAAWLHEQPSWSEFPFILLTARGGGLEKNVEALRAMEIFGNINFLERPFHPTTLVSLTQSSLRSRQRQYQTRRYLQDLEAAATNLAASEDARVKALEGAGVGTWELFPDQDRLVWDVICRRLFGLGPGAPLTLEVCMSLIAEEDRAQVTAAVEEAITPGFDDLYKTEFRLAGSAADPRWLSVSGRLYQEPEHGRRLAGTVWDISERKQAELDLRDLNETLEMQVQERTRERDSMWNLSTDLMLVERFDGTIIAVNPAWEALLAWGESDLVGRSVTEYIHADDLAAAAREIESLSQGQNTFRIENRYRHRDGTYRWISWTAVPQSSYIYATGRDITAEKKAAADLLTMEEQLRQAQKMEAVGQLTGGIAHDFNNLLAGINGSLELARVRIKQGRIGDLDRYMEAAWASGQRAAGLTHRLLAFSRRQTLDPKPTEVNDLIASMEDLIRRTIGPDIDFRTNLAPNLWQTRCDSHQLESALLNLAINSRDAMPAGGRLSLETKNSELTAVEMAGQTDVLPGNFVAIAVSDTGSGMSPDIISRAFEPFFTTKPLGQGTGLGLSMVYGFVKQSGGHIQIVSEESVGTTITIYLPQNQLGTDHSEEENREDAPAHSQDGETILVVDDEILVRSVVCETLSDLGYKIIEAGNGSDALKIIEKNQGIDLLLTDVGLPGGMNGRQLAEAARNLRPQLRILFITGYAAHAALEESLMHSNMQVMTKPFSMEALGVKVKAVIDGHDSRGAA